MKNFSLPRNFKISLLLLSAFLLSALAAPPSFVVHRPSTVLRPPSSFAPPRAGTTLHFTHLTSEDGLAQNSVEAILQDRQGFMWIGTSAGLSRYDGYHFTNYQNDPENPNSLSSNWIRDLYE